MAYGYTSRTVCFNVAHDADLLDWLDSLPEKRRSAEVRRILRLGRQAELDTSLRTLLSETRNLLRDLRYGIGEAVACSGSEQEGREPDELGELERNLLSNF